MKAHRFALFLPAFALAACSTSSPVAPGNEEEVFTILAQAFAQAVGSDPGASFEGIAVDATGEFVYVASYFRGTLVKLRASDLSVAGTTDLPLLVEGLTIAPDGSLLAVHKDAGLSILATPSLAPIALHNEGGGYFVANAGAGRALTSGNHPLALLDTESGETLAEYAAPGGGNMWHFAVAPDGGLIAALRSDNAGREIHMLTPDLELNEAFDFRAYGGLGSIHYHTNGKLYMLARDVFRTDYLVVINLAARTSSAARLNPSDCNVLCVANPVAVSREGRWVVFGGERSAYFVDTTVDRLVALLGSSGGGSGVAASPTEDAFFFLRGDGLVTKVSYPILPGS